MLLTNVLNKGNFILSCYFMVVMFGCLWQSSQLIHLYLSYPTKIVMETQFDLYRDSLASFTYCKNHGGKHGGKYSDEMFEYYKTIKILHWIGFPYQPNENINQTLYKLTTMISSNYYCLVIKCNETRKVTGQSFAIYLNDAVFHDQWWVYIHNKDEHMSSYEWNGLSLTKNYQYSLTYNVRSFRLLPSPYATDCFDYSKRSQFMSRKDCIRKCKLRQSIEKCGVISRDMDIYYREPNVRFADTENETHCVRMLNVIEYCSDKCPRYDCFKQYMEAKVIEENVDKSMVNIVHMFKPFEPKTTYYHKPSIEIVEFLCYLASTLGLWFGFSIISVSLRLKDLILVKVLNNYHKLSFPTNHIYNLQIPSEALPRFRARCSSTMKY